MNHRLLKGKVLLTRKEVEYLLNTFKLDSVSIRCKGYQSDQIFSDDELEDNNGIHPADEYTEIYRDGLDECKTDENWYCFELWY